MTLSSASIGLENIEFECNMNLQIDIFAFEAKYCSLKIKVSQWFRSNYMGPFYKFRKPCTTSQLIFAEKWGQLSLHLHSTNNK
jgi:hypothetical protein